MQSMSGRALRDLAEITLALNVCAANNFGSRGASEPRICPAVVHAAFCSIQLRLSRNYACKMLIQSNIPPSGILVAAYWLLPWLCYLDFRKVL